MESNLYLPLRLLDLPMRLDLEVVVVEVLGMAALLSALIVITVFALVIIRIYVMHSMVALRRLMLQFPMVQTHSPWYLIPLILSD